MVNISVVSDYGTTFLSALAALQSHASTMDERRGAGDWLLAFQRTPECWVVAKHLLRDATVPPHVQVVPWIWAIFGGS